MASLLNRLRDVFPTSTVKMNASATPLVALHPYYPIEAEIVGYLANERNTLELCSMFAAGCTVIFSLTFLTVKKLRPDVSTSDLITVMWFVLCMNKSALREGIL